MKTIFKQTVCAFTAFTLVTAGSLFAKDKTIGEKTDKAIEKTEKGVNSAKDKVKEKAHDAKDKAKDLAHDAKEKAKDTGHEAKKRAHDVKEAAKGNK